MEAEPANEISGNAAPPRSRGPVPRGKLLALTVLLVAAAGLWWLLREELTLSSLAQRAQELRLWQRESPLLVYGAAFLLYVVITGLSLPGAAVLTLLFGWYFGWLRGVLLVSFASTAGATVAFLLTRYIAGEFVRSQYAGRLSGFNAALARDGPYYLFTLRLIPAVPFFVVNAVMGLTPIRVTTFWWVSQLGMLPATCVYVYAGATVPSLATLADRGVGAAFTATQIAQITGSFAILGVFPLLVGWCLSRWNRG